ncbi:type II toxin-antitoxin system RelE/ParE family toxin [Erythrobacter sp. NE805]|uniref:type II toxin-antitoxin system RelE/ParE family toxin n=1 Tax=Erythrobacter sp. NE805 TaxID=3389875 RepID=UPI00396B4403
MLRVEISPLARGDLETIDDYGLSGFGEPAANAMQAAIREAFVMLAEFPRSAPERPEFGENIRCKVLRGYRILYRLDEKRIIIVRVLHHSRSAPVIES